MVEASLRSFLAPFKGKSLVIGLSGGADSMALFYAALKLGQPLVAAHVDHGWREESAQEAAWLEAVAREAGVPFTLKRCARGDFWGI